MAITRAKQSSLRTGVTKYDNLRAGLPFTPTIGTATDGGTGSTVSVAFTTNNTAGLTYTALSTPGSLTGTSTTSPITVSGLTSGTAYTFQVNAANSAGTSPYSAASNSVTPATPSSYESIASATPTGTGTVTFSSIPSGYSSLQIRGVVISADTDAYCVRLNTDTGANYARHRLLGTGAATAASGTTSTNQVQISNGTDTIPSPFIVDVHDYASTTKYKTLRSLQGIDQNGSGNVALYSGLWMSTSAVTSVTIFLNSGNYSTGTQISLYGIKG